ncbi:TPA: flagellar motor switch protein FliG, partial [Legionella pneumophila]|nr:flagellar motor switch protein FliG [Legionella pneumophila]
MDGIERAAILLLSMGEKNASEVLKHLEPRQVQKVGMAMSTMNSVSKAKMQNVLIDFISAIEDQTS